MKAKEEVVTFRVTRDLNKALNEAARRHKTSKGGIIRAALLEWLETDAARQLDAFRQELRPGG